MSKSLGNVVSPQDVVTRHGADVLRLWVVGSDYSGDLRIGPEILKQHADVYRRFRNTFRFLLGNLNGFNEAERLPYEELPELERWVLHRLDELNRAVRESCDRLVYHQLFTELHTFCAVDLSALYFDVRKDALYCDPPDAKRRRATRTVLDHLFDCLTAWLAPLLCFTAEEAWLSRHPNADGSVHDRLFPEVPSEWRDEELAKKWALLRQLRRVVTGAIEVERGADRIRSSLQAHPLIFAGPQYQDVARDIDLAELCITSAATLQTETAPEDAFRLSDVSDVGVVIDLAQGRKCERCWQILDEVGTDLTHPQLCRRCTDAFERHHVAAE